MIILSLLILLSMQFYIFYITTFQHTRYISNLIRSVLYHFMVLCYVLWCGGVCKIVHTILDVEMMLLHVKCFTWHGDHRCRSKCFTCPGDYRCRNKCFTCPGDHRCRNKCFTCPGDHRCRNKCFTCPGDHRCRNLGSLMSIPAPSKVWSD